MIPANEILKIHQDYEREEGGKCDEAGERGEYCEGDERDERDRLDEGGK